MKVLVMYVEEFSYQPAQKNLEEVDDITEGAQFSDSILAFIQVEESDEEKDVKSREKKLVNHLKWTARKNDCKSVILHSFAHLSESKASVEFTKELFDLAENRLQNADFTTAQTPFGYFLDLNIKAPGFSLARIWATL
ncbi:threonyl-tRNA synthetase editing domain-containing protein [Draconibacterium orientale]|uniref:threonyl-tRNA synthetase editing domain-containing protein n=1 Tax=Draconibacterium orientale TaxID=1168034 RepID=UPI0029C0F683|nr:threonyl-tRNA synthetase editing domain-containing protein [Draconibacterium orientale]